MKLEAQKGSKSLYLAIMLISGSTDNVTLSKIGWLLLLFFVVRLATSQYWMGLINY